MSVSEALLTASWKCEGSNRKKKNPQNLLIAKVKASGQCYTSGLEPESRIREVSPSLVFRRASSRAAAEQALFGQFIVSGQHVFACGNGVFERFYVKSRVQHFSKRSLSKADKNKRDGKDAKRISTFHAFISSFFRGASSQEAQCRRRTVA